MTTTTPTTTTTTISAQVRKVLSAPDVIRTAVERIIIGATDDKVRPSDIRRTLAGLKSGMGAKPSLPSFIEGLAGLVCRLAYGQIRIEQALEGLPPFAKFAVETAEKRVVRGSGITVGTLRDLVADAAIAASALPLKSSPDRTKSPKTLSAPTPTPTPTPPTTTTTTTDDDERAEKRASAIVARMHMQALHEASGIYSDAARHEERARYFEDVRERAQAEPAAPEELPSRQKAIAFCRMADSLGIKLTKTQLAVLDKLEQMGQVPA